MLVTLAAAALIGALAGCDDTATAGDGGSGTGSSSGTGGATSSSGSGGSTGGATTSGSTSGSGSSGGTTTTGGTTGGGVQACDTTGAEITDLPGCSVNTSGTLDVRAGCIPQVDGRLHLAEWSDAQCLQVWDDLTFAFKYAGSNLYIAAAGQPTCGCGMQFEFDPDGTSALDGDEFSIQLFDDPFNANGDRNDFTVQGGAFALGTAPAGIVTSCPCDGTNPPSPDRFEWKIPLTALGITPGTAHTFRFAFVHDHGTWPTSLTVGAAGFALNPGDWGQLSSSTNWQ
jgi:hypothetical protein